MRNHIAAQDPHTQYAQKHNPTFTGEPKAPTPAAGNNTTRIATTEFVQAAITALINGAPATLDTLKEIAAAINNDPKFSTTINNALSGKQPRDNTLTNLSGKDVAGLLAYLGLGTAAKKDVGTGTGQVPDMSSFTVTGNVNAFVMQLPGGIVIQGGKVSTDANGFATVNLGLAMSFYSVLTGESAVSNWVSSGNVYSGLVIYGAQSLGTTSFGFRSIWWQGADKTFKGGSATAHWIAVGRV